MSFGSTLRILPLTSVRGGPQADGAGRAGNAAAHPVPPRLASSLRLPRPPGVTRRAPAAAQRATAVAFGAVFDRARACSGPDLGGVHSSVHLQTTCTFTRPALPWPQPLAAAPYGFPPRRCPPRAAACAWWRRPAGWLNSASCLAPKWPAAPKPQFSAWPAPRTAQPYSGQSVIRTWPRLECVHVHECPHRGCRTHRFAHPVPGRQVFVLRPRRVFDVLALVLFETYT